MDEGSAVVSTLPILGEALNQNPIVFGLILFLITPGAHIAFALLLERRPIRLKDDYPAVLFGDPLLALAGAIGLYIAGADLSWVASWPAGVLAVVVGVTFGYLQSKHEERSNIYRRSQILSPSKLWHQYVVYPTVGYLVPAATVSGYLQAERNIALASVMTICLLVWGATVVDALKNPRLGHGGFDWKHFRAVPEGGIGGPVLGKD